ncbi:hypothetical protein EPR50_G00208360 [Perca flavescens]|uniref:Uncharacterized protein n=1 Tax=Perca flavescens TaxID=8167 RepID=A0A484C5A2_PERFV|nr:hypothetical protein EPR50_G00208360 [Perca flavescens]
MSLPLNSYKQRPVSLFLPSVLLLFLAVTEIAAVRLESASPSCTAALTQREMEAEIWRRRLGEGEGRQPKRLQVFV